MYCLGVLVEEDEEGGLSPSFCTYTLYISYLFYTQESSPVLTRGHLSSYQQTGKLS